MTNEQTLSLLNKGLEHISKVLDGFYNALPKYLRNEMLHPKKETKRKYKKGEKRKGDGR